MARNGILPRLVRRVRVNWSNRHALRETHVRQQVAGLRQLLDECRDAKTNDAVVRPSALDELETAAARYLKDTYGLPESRTSEYVAMSRGVAAMRLAVAKSDLVPLRDVTAHLRDRSQGVVPPTFRLVVADELEKRFT